MTEQTLGKYHILEELGRGGFATVYRALDTTLEREIALKVLDPLLMRDETWVERFHREAKAVARLKHSRIVTIHEIGEAGGRLFIAMELVEGPALNGLIAERGRLSWDETLDILAQVADALDYAHGEGIIHRDLKPGNILLDPRKGAVLTDFGFAKLVGESSMSVSLSGGVVGTPQYIAPEVWENRQPTVAVDMYALGCILYELVTGEQLFKGDSAPAIMRAHFKPLQLPERWPEGVPDGIDGVLRMALAQETADRHASAGRLVKALKALTLDALAEPYAALQAAEAGERWEEALALAAQIRAHNADYRDVVALETQALQGREAGARAEQAAMWRQEAETALAEGERSGARVAVGRWLEMAPGDAEAQALLERLTAAPPEETPPEPEAVPPPRAKQVRSEGDFREQVGWKGVPAWAWALGGLAVLALVVGVVTGVGDGATTALPTVALATEAPTEAPPTEPLLTPTAGPTVTPFPSATPAGPSLGDTWARQADGMVMVYVPAGEFEMGSDDDEVDYALQLCNEYYDHCERGWFEREQPVHTVVLDGFWIDQIEVTNDQYRRCVEAGDCEPPADSDSFTRDSYYGNSAYDDYPVIYVSWRQAADYCAWAGGRLPTEAEWECAARGPEASVYPWGDEWDENHLNSWEGGPGDTTEVGGYPGGASWCEALDMAGNVWEWVADWYGEYPSGRQVNPTGPSSGTYRVLRGGSWLDNRNWARSAYRSRYNPDNRNNDSGFRCCVSPTSSP